MRLSDPFGACVRIDLSAADQTVSPPSRGFLIATTGLVEMVMADGGQTVIVPLTGGVIHRIKVKQVKKAGTAALECWIWR